MIASGLSSIPMEELLRPVLVQLAVILAAARLFGLLARRLGQPSVVGEILVGILLGPSFFGALAPDWHAAVFTPALPEVPAETSKALLPLIFGILAQIGLILLLFFVGLEFDYEHLKVKGTSALTIMLAGVVVPFCLGMALAPWVHPQLEPHPRSGPVPLAGLRLFLGTAMCITALPVLGRIILELGIERTRLATVVIAAAAMGDAVGWILLATVSATARTAFSPEKTAMMIGLTVAFLAVMQWLVRPIASRFFARTLQANGGELSITSLAVLLTLLLICAIATNLIGIFAIFGAFLLGAVLSDVPQLRNATRRLRDFVTAFFVPIFFTYTGLRTEIDTVGGLWVVALVFFAVGFSSKIVGCLLAARCTGFRWREAAIVGTMMNTRGLMELIVINVGYELGVIPRSLYCVLVLLALLSNLLTTPVILLLRRGTELEEPIRESGFLRSA